MKKVLGIAVLILGVPALALAGPGDWAFLASVNGPVSAPVAPATSTLGTIRGTADSTGQVYFSVSNADVKGVFKSTDFIASVTAVPAVAPTWALVHSNSAMSNGFQGVACDSSDNVFFVGDRAAGNDGEITKYVASGTQDATFGSVTPVPRLTGADVMSNGSLIAASNPGDLYQFSATDGSQIATLGAATSGLTTYCRDIAVKQDSTNGDVLFLNQSGDLKMVTGGSAADITAYNTVADLGTGISWVAPTPAYDVNQGVEYFAADDTVIYTNFTDQMVYVVAVSDGTVVQSIDVSSLAPKISDVVTFSSGSTDFLVVTTSGAGGLTVYSKSNGSAVSDWALLN